MATKYDIVPSSKEIENEDRSASRRDDLGLWNSIHAWYLFALHPAASIGFVACMLRGINGQHFQTGSPSSAFQTDTPLYQTQINGIVSLALVGIRLLASACTALLVWRMIFVLLDKEGITLAELTRMNNYRIPILPRLKTRSQLLWSSWAVMLVLFLWPPNFAAPLANSSLSWTPSAKISGSSTSIIMPSLGNASDLEPVGSQDWRMTSLINAAVMTGMDPGYAFNNIEDHPLRRYFHPSVNITNSSRISANLPYAKFQVKWKDAPDAFLQKRLPNSLFTDFVDPSPGANTLSRFDGSVILVREDPYEPNSPFDAPNESNVFMGSRLVAVQVSTHHDTFDLNGSYTDADLACTSISPYLGTLPGPAQFPLIQNSTPQSGYTDCYQIGAVTVTAGTYAATDCEILSAGSFAKIATSVISQDAINIQADWIAPVAFEMMSEIMKESLLLNYTQQYIANDLDTYTTGMLTLAYHAAWSYVMESLGATNETASLRMAAPMVQAGVGKGKLYVWLAMNLSLLVAAILMYVALSFSSVKAIRDITLTPLMADFSAVTSSEWGSGLRDAVTLSKEDHKLPRMKLCGDGTYNFVDEIGTQTHHE